MQHAVILQAVRAEVSPFLWARCCDECIGLGAMLYDGAGNYCLMRVGDYPDRNTAAYVGGLLGDWLRETIRARGAITYDEAQQTALRAHDALRYWRAV